MTSYVHNGFGEVIQQTSPDTGVTIFEYDSAGRRTKRTDARGVVTDWTYDDLGRTLTMTFPASPAENVTYTYDDATTGWYSIGRMASVTDDSGSTSYRYDARGNIVRVESVIGAQSYVTQYGYDLADRMVQMTYPSGRIVDYARDALGRVSGVTTKANAGAPVVTLASGLTYEAFAGIDAMTYGNGVTLSLGHDLNGRLAAMDVFNGAMPLLDLDYIFDLAGNITDIDDLGGGSRGRDFAYDNLHRLTQGKELAPGGAPVTLQTDYTYDAVGNRQTRTVGGALETYVYDAFSNRLDTVTAGAVTRRLGYSGSGNTDSDDNGAGTVLTNLYDSTDRLAEVKNGAATVATYLHNAAQGLRVAKTVGAVTTHYLYDLGGNLIAEADGATGATAAEYVWLAAMPLAYIEGGAPYYVHTDHLATPQRLTDATGAVVWDANYRPFGKPTVSGSLTFNLRFPGQYYDAETNLHYNNFRDYDASTGRYVQSDPTGLAGGLNTYAYAGGNPIGYFDILGLRRITGEIDDISVDSIDVSVYDFQPGNIENPMCRARWGFGGNPCLGDAVWTWKYKVSLAGTIKILCREFDTECGVEIEVRNWTISLSASGGFTGQGYKVIGPLDFLPVPEKAALYAWLAYKYEKEIADDIEKYAHYLKKAYPILSQIDGPTILCQASALRGL